jgi:hypothetical protein
VTANTHIISFIHARRQPKYAFFQISLVLEEPLSQQHHGLGNLGHSARDSNVHGFHVLHWDSKRISQSPKHVRGSNPFPIVVQRAAMADLTGVQETARDEVIAVRMVDGDTKTHRTAVSYLMIRPRMPSSISLMIPEACACALGAAAPVHRAAAAERYWAPLARPRFTGAATLLRKAVSRLPLREFAELGPPAGRGGVIIQSPRVRELLSRRPWRTLPVRVQYWTSCQYPY